MISLIRRRNLPTTRRSFCTTSHRPCPSATSSSSRPPKLRFAPSPTGYLHLGGLRTALYNHLLARKCNAKWVLRVEDTDQTRYVEGAVESLLKTLKWAKLDFDEGPGKEESGNGPYFQSKRKEVYDKYLQPLIDSGKAYHCFCTPSRLAETRKTLQKMGKHEGYDRKCLGLDEDEVRRRLEDGEKSVVRFKSSSTSLTQTDLIYSPITYDNLPLEDFVLRKSDGLPTYHFANVVDDWEMGVTHVLRGEEWLPSTPKHLQLYDALNLPRPQFAHLPLLINTDGSKLSKRTGDVKVEDYIDKGYEPEALLNFVALLGWSPQSDASAPSPSSSSSSSSTTSPTPDSPGSSTASDLLTLPQLISQFSLEAINKNRPTLPQGKLDWLNRQHVKLKLLSMEEGSGEVKKDLAERTKAVVEKEVEKEGRFGTEDWEYVLAVVDALKDRLHTINDIPSLGRYFFTEPDYSAQVSKKMYKAMNSKVYRETLQAAIPIVASLPSELFSRSISSSPESNIQLDQEILTTLSSISIVNSSPPSSSTSSPDASTMSRDVRQKASQTMSPLRHALTGQKVGASVATTVRVLGRDRTKERLERAVRWSEEMEKR